ncbi:hypothetical protein NECAME_08969, partial [Necator americanus]
MTLDDLEGRLVEITYLNTMALVERSLLNARSVISRCTEQSFAQIYRSFRVYNPAKLGNYSIKGGCSAAGQRCRQCGVIAHDKCIVNITWPCDSRTAMAPHMIQEYSLPPTPLKSYADQQNTVARSETMLSDFGEGNGGRTLTIGHGLVSSSRTTPLHQGYLSKKGAKFKLWAPRWFELEANSHKMYYYESEHDMECRGYIDLCDVGSVEVENSGSKAILEVIFPI